MNNLLKPRPKKKFGTDRGGPIRCQGHLGFVRKRPCAIVGQHTCSGAFEAHHVREGQRGGTGLKPSDSETVCLCSIAHKEQHRIGERAFELKYQIDMKKSAQECWQADTYHRRKHESAVHGGKLNG